MQIAEALRKTVATTVAASLLLVTPGTSAVAQQFSGRIATPAPVAPVPAAAGAAALSKPSLSLPGSLSAPVLPSPAALSAAPIPAAAAPGTVLAAPASLYKAPVQAAAVQAPVAAVGRVAAPIAAMKDASGAMGILSHQTRGADAADAPEAAGWLVPAAEALASPQASRAWAANAFDAMRGGKPGEAAAPVAGSQTQGRSLLSRPSLTVNKAHEGLPAPGKGGKGGKALAIVKIVVPVALGITGLGMYLGFIPMMGLASLLEFVPTFGLPLPAMMALGVGAQIVFKIGKTIWKSRQEKKVKEAEKAKASEAAKSLAPEALTGEAAVDAVSKRLGTNLGVSKYDFSTGQLHEVPVDQKLIDDVKAGQYKVTTDSTGTLILVPVLVPEEAPAANAVKDEAPASAPALAPVETAKPVSPAAPIVAAPASAPAAPAVPAGAKTVSNNPSGKAGKTPKSISSLPVDAQALDAARLADGKAKAQVRARALASDARLVRVTINLDDPKAHPAYVFYSKKQGKILTVWEKRIGVKKGKETTDVLWNPRLAGIRGLSEAYAALKADAHWFKPVRVELRPHWKGSAQYVFLDAKGREMKVSAAAAAPTPTPEVPAPPADEPEKPAPP
ncbi:MAG: hypothetical protein FD126_1488, partial [Elusimicrobia bacterium]